MELWEELLEDFTEEEICDCLRGLGELLQSKCYKLLQEIREILKEEAADDASCFMRIEKIVCAYEEAGIGCGTRHDFS